MNEEVLKMYAELTQEVSLCQDEDIKTLGKGILELANNYDKSLKEIERLNNIINEAINYTTKQMKKYEGYDRDFEIVLSNIVVMLGSDKK